MEDNKKIKTGLVIAGILFLAAVIGYPYIKELRRSRGVQEISLGEVTAQESVQEGAGTDAGTGAANEEEQGASTEGTAGSEALQSGREIGEILLTVQTEDGLIKTGMWQSVSGLCCFFLPGFAKESSLTVELTDEKSTLFIGEKEICSGDSITNINWEQEYALKFESGDGKTTVDSRVVFLHSSDLPVLSLTTASGSMEIIDAEKGNEETGTVEFLAADGKVIYTGTAESISGRGNSTWGLLKKPYQFRLLSSADLLGTGKAGAWNLLANGYDDTKLRNKIALDMAEELGMDYVPDYKIVDLYINQVYYGNYYLTEKISVSEESVDIRDMERITEAAYTAQELEKLAVCENEEKTRKWAELQYEEQDLTGGYLIERELPDRYQQEISGFVTKEGDCYALQSPAYASENQVNYIAGLMQELEDALKEEDGINRETGKSYLEYLDLDSFVQQYLVEEISKNYDGGVTSSFFYKPQDSVSTKLFAGPVWDYDVAFGNCNLDEIAGNPVGLTLLNDHVLGTEMFKRLYGQEDFYLAVTALYSQKALPYLNLLLDGEIDRMAEEYRQAVKLDGIRWEELENRYHYYEEYDNNVRYLKYFIEKRRDFLSEVWLEGAVYHNVNFMVDGENWQIYCVKDGETAGQEPVPARNNSLFMGWWTGEGIPYDPYKPVYEDKTFHALWQEIETAEAEE